MIDLKFLDAIIRDEFKINSSKLEEEGEDTDGKTFTMTRDIVKPSSIEYSVYRFDTNKSIFPFLSNASDVTKMCDYMIFVREKGLLHVLLIELKFGRKNTKKQLDAGECLANFILATAKRVNPEVLDTNNIFVKKIKISESRSKKKRVNRNPEELENGIIESKDPKRLILAKFLNYSTID